MALQLKDRILTLCTTVGRGDAIIGETKEGYSGWEGITYGNTVYYCITDDTAWEVGYGNYMNRGSTQAISRTVLSSSDNNEKIPLSGKSSIFCTYPAEKSVYLNKDGNLYFPAANAHLNSIVGNEVTSANVVTSAVIVDGTEGLNNENLAGLLNVYKKEEVDELFMPKTGGKFTGKVVIKYEEEGLSTPLEIIGDYENTVLKFWSHGGIETTYKNFRDNDLVTKAYVDGKTDRDAVTCEQFWNNASWNTDNMVDALVSQIKVHNDRTALVLNKNGSDTNITKNWENELSPYPSYFGIKIGEEIHFVEVEFTGKGGTNNRGYNFKILAHNLPETVENGTLVGICASYTPEPLTVADYQNFMPDGGTVTGQVKHKKEIIIEPTMPSRFINIKNRYATEADGTPTGSDNTGFGVNFDLDHGNSGYNQVKWTTRNGNVLAVYGGTQANAKYTGVITDGQHLVNKAYVDSKVSTSTAGATIQTLNVREASYNENTDFSNPTDFFANTSTTTDTTELKFKQAYDHRNNLVNVVDYRETGATRVKVYERATADLVYDGIVKEILLESDIAVYKCLPLFTAVNHDWLRTSNKYTFILENIVEDK